MFGSTRVHITLLLLVAAYTLNQWDRYMLNYLSGYVVKACASICAKVEHREACKPCGDNEACIKCDNCLANNTASRYNIQEATCISEAQYGLLTGFAFVLIYVFVGLLAGRLADKYSRKALIISGLVVWSVATGAQGLATGFLSLLGIRFVLGVGEAFLSPAVYSFISDTVEPEKRALANSMYSVGVYLGGGFASLSILLSAEVGWRGTSFLGGCAGILVGVIMLAVVAEPSRGGKKAMLSSADSTSEGLSTGAVAKLVVANRSLRLVFIGSMARYFAGFSIATFLVKYFAVEYPDENEIYSVTNAVAVVAGGSISSVGGGLIVSRWSESNRKAQAYVPAIGSLLAIPCMAMLLFVHSFTLSMGLLFLEYVAAECWLGPILSLVQDLVPASAVGTVSALLIAATTLCGSIAPVALGALYDHYDTHSSLRFLLLTFICIPYCIAAACFYLSVQHVSSRSMSQRKERNESVASLLADSHADLQSVSS